MERRKLGRTDMTVSVLGFGGIRARWRAVAEASWEGQV